MKRASSPKEINKQIRLMNPYPVNLRTFAFPKLSRCEKELGNGMGLNVPFSMLV
jgi:hypothetical protein